MKICGETKAPAGWHCTRELGHEGPCAAIPLWEADCMYWRGKVLRGPDAHWCNDWDGLPVSAFTMEYDCCHEKKTLLGRICNWFYVLYWNFRVTMSRIDNEKVAWREEWADDFKQ